MDANIYLWTGECVLIERVVKEPQKTKDQYGVRYIPAVVLVKFEDGHTEEANVSDLRADGGINTIERAVDAARLRGAYETLGVPNPLSLFWQMEGALQHGAHMLVIANGGMGA